MKQMKIPEQLKIRSKYLQVRKNHLDEIRLLSSELCWVAEKVTEFSIVSCLILLQFFCEFLLLCKG